MELNNSTERPRKHIYKNGDESPFSVDVISIDADDNLEIVVFCYMRNRWELMDGELPDSEDFKWCYKPDWLVY